MEGAGSAYLQFDSAAFVKLLTAATVDSISPGSSVSAEVRVLELESCPTVFWSDVSELLIASVWGANCVLTALTAVFPVVSTFSTAEVRELTPFFRTSSLPSCLTAALKLLTSWQ